MPTRHSGISQSDCAAVLRHRLWTAAVRFALVLLLAGLGTTPARAQTTISVPWDGVFPALCGIFNTPDICGQSFVVPTGDNVLQSFTFPIATLDTVSFEIYALSLGHLDGPALFTAPVGPLGNADPDYHDAGHYEEATITFPGGGLALTSGALYAAVMRMEPGEFVDFQTSEDHYPGGARLACLSLNGCPTDRDVDVITSQDLAFTATFGRAPVANVAPEPVSMLLLGTGLMGVGGTALRRRRKSAGDAAA
ncbi:MAG TPA: PEP-CTERM sorting domain-containing protein [Longimicrobiales bacterium]